jgi:rhodanese-related sulfurtransferase
MRPKRVLVALFALVVACNSPVGLPLGVLGILQVEEAEDLIEANGTNPEFVILDVRTEAEYAAGHLEGAAWIDWLAGDFEERVSELPRESLYLVYCAGGSRSAQACEEMERLGFERLYDLGGGFTAWDEAGCLWVCD